MAKQELTLNTSEISKKLNENVFKVIGNNDTLVGFEKAYLIASAAGELQSLLTTEYMKPIMALQNNRLGFKTDKEAGYSEAVVKNCLIEAVLMGLQPFGNQFNIIAGNTYATKEGMGHLLSQIKGLDWEIIPGLPRINAEKTGAAVLMKVKWTYGGATKEREVDIAVKMNQYAGVDAAIGKATRKARAWLFNTVTGSEIGDGDVQDVDYKTVPEKPPVINRENERMSLLIKQAKTLDDLEVLGPDIDDAENLEEWKARKAELTKP